MTMGMMLLLDDDADDHLTWVPRLWTRGGIDNIIAFPFFKRKISKYIFWLLNTSLKIAQIFFQSKSFPFLVSQKINKGIHISSMKERGWDILSHTLLSWKKTVNAFVALVKLFTFIFRCCSWSTGINKYSLGRLQMVNINCCIYQFIIELCNYS